MLDNDAGAHNDFWFVCMWTSFSHSLFHMKRQVISSSPALTQLLKSYAHIVIELQQSKIFETIGKNVYAYFT